VSIDSHAADGTDGGCAGASESAELHRDDTRCDDRRGAPRTRSPCTTSARSPVAPHRSRM